MTAVATALAVDVRYWTAAVAVSNEHSHAAVIL